jgi:RNA polymerase sigma factor (sigma-70 family)
MTLYDLITDTEIIKLREDLLNFFKGRLKDNALSEDCTQYVFLIGDKVIDKFDDKKGTIQKFLFGIAKTIVLKIMGQNGGLGAFNHYICTTLGDEFNPALGTVIALNDNLLPPVRNLVLESHDLEQLFIELRHEIFVRLPPKYKSWEYMEILDMLYLHELSIKDMNKVIKINERTLRSRVDRFKEEIQKAIRKIEASKDGALGKECKIIFD